VKPAEAGRTGEKPGLARREAVWPRAKTKPAGSRPGGLYDFVLFFLTEMILVSVLLPWPRPALLTSSLRV